MRVPVVLAALILSGPAVAAGPQQQPNAQGANCQRNTNYLAGEIGVYRGKPVSPKKLTELPKGTPYMAVLRHINGCDAPLTMVEYRNPRRR